MNIMETLHEYEGPRAPTPEEEPALSVVAHLAFSGGVDPVEGAANAWPMPPDPLGILSMFHHGQPVSSIQRLERDVLAHGHRLRVGLIGGVCTHPDHRNRGLASVLLDAQFQQMRRDEVDVVYISGGRGLYLRAGADFVGMETRFTVDESARLADLPVQLVRADSGDIDRLVDIAQQESVRFLRPRADWEVVIKNGHCGGKPCAFYLVELRRTPVAYLLASHEPGAPTLQVLELAGDRLCALSAMHLLRAQLAGQVSIEVGVPHGDPLIDLLSAVGVAGQVVRSEGTLKLLDFSATMSRLRLYFQECLAESACRDLRFAAGEGRAVAWQPGGVFQLEGERAALWALLGRPPGIEEEGVRVLGTTHEWAARCLPIPLPTMYLNMI